MKELKQCEERGEQEEDFQCKDIHLLYFMLKRVKYFSSDDCQKRETWREKENTSITI